MDFSGKTAFVTGAANGIGLGICRALARNGVNLVLADIEQAALEKARAELATFNVPCDPGRRLRRRQFRACR
jgi:NAD(P)-dependent dehydrogenase (short-subunit alcohol dehydrogenase family)